MKVSNFLTARQHKFRRDPTNQRGLAMYWVILQTQSNLAIRLLI